MIAYGWSPEELKFQHSYLSMGQIYSAFAYYADHEDELQQEIDRRLTAADMARQKIGTILPPADLKAFDKQCQSRFTWMFMSLRNCLRSSLAC